MSDNRRTPQRIDHLQGLLDIEYEKLEELEREYALAPPGELKASLEFTLKHKLWPRIRELACQRRPEQGERVFSYFGMVEFFPRIKGVFTGVTDGFVSTGETNDWCSI